LPEKCIYWPSQRCLLISDVHLGKVDHFRKNGIGIPSKATLGNYHLLQHLIQTYSPERILFLGDIFHSTLNKDWLRFRSFVEANQFISFELVKGNHDILDNALFEEVFDQIYHEQLVLKPFLFTHDIVKDKELYNLCGHIHPSIRIKGKGLQSIRLPCFYFAEDHGILPAFGSFTGTYTLTPSSSDTVYVIAEDEVLSFC